MVYLRNPKQPSEVEIINLLFVLLSNELAVEDNLRTLESEFGIPITYEIKQEVMNLFNLNDAIEQ